MPFIFPEWICERISYLLGRWAFLDILGYAGRLTILIAVIAYFMEADERRMQAENQRKAKHYQAWQVINAAQGKRSSGGRMDALKDLNSENVSLAGVDVSNATLPDLNLQNADLSDANLCGANLVRANLSGARLSGANLSGADLIRADLSQVSFQGADLSGAYLWSANLSGAHLFRANLVGAKLLRVKNWQKIENIRFANIYGVEDAPSGFAEWAKKHGAVNYESHTKWRDLLEQLDKKMMERFTSVEDLPGEQKRVEASERD